MNARNKNAGSTGPQTEVSEQEKVTGSRYGRPSPGVGPAPPRPATPRATPDGHQGALTVLAHQALLDVADVGEEVAHGCDLRTEKAECDLGSPLPAPKEVRADGRAAQEAPRPI